MSKNHTLTSVQIPKCIAKRLKGSELPALSRFQCHREQEGHGHSIFAPCPPLSPRVWGVPWRMMCFFRALSAHFPGVVYHRSSPPWVNSERATASEPSHPIMKIHGVEGQCCPESKITEPKAWRLRAVQGSWRQRANIWAALLILGPSDKAQGPSQRMKF